jgi:hypothetical protein
MHSGKPAKPRSQSMNQSITSITTVVNSRLHRRCLSLRRHHGQAAVTSFRAGLTSPPFVAFLQFDGAHRMP